MSRREVARAARRTIRTAEDRLRRGDAVLCFPKALVADRGGCSRFLPGVSRYFENQTCWWSRSAFAAPNTCSVLANRHLARRDHDEHRAADRVDRFARKRFRPPAFIDRLGHEVAALLPPRYQAFTRRLLPESPAPQAGLKTRLLLEKFGLRRRNSANSPASHHSAVIKVSRLWSGRWASTFDPRPADSQGRDPERGQRADRRQGVDLPGRPHAALKRQVLQVGHHRDRIESANLARFSRPSH